MQVWGNGLGRSAVVHVPAWHNHGNGTLGTVKRLRNRPLPAVYGNIQMHHLLSRPTVRRAARSCGDVFRPRMRLHLGHAAAPVASVVLTGCRECSRPALPVTELPSEPREPHRARSCVGSSERGAAAPVLSVAALPAMAAQRASALPGHLQTPLLSALVCRAPTRPVCLALPAVRRDRPARVEPGLARAVKRRQIAQFRALPRV